MRRLQTALIAFVFLLACSAPMIAHEKGKKLEARDYGYENGYPDGYRHGRNDRDRRARFEMRSEDYKDADRGYDKYMGDKDKYKQGYREGYPVGYDDGYNLRAARFGSPGTTAVVVPAPQTTVVVPGGEPTVIVPGERNRSRIESSDAFSVGYRDGEADGRRDLSDVRGFRPEDHSLYRDADHGYTSTWGDRDDYRRRYRDGYMEGYRNAYGRR